MDGWKNTLSPREPLIALISVVLIAGFFITNISAYYISKESLKQALLSNELPLTSNNIYSEIQRDLLQPVFISSLMANDTLVKDWLLTGENDLDKITRYLEEIRNRYNVFTSFLVSDATRNYYHFTGLRQIVDERDPSDEWFFRVRNMKEPQELNVDLNAEQDNAITIFINHKVHGYDGEFLAAVGVGLELDTVAEIISRYKEYFGRHIYFVDDEGNVLLRSEGSDLIQGNIHLVDGISDFSKDILSTPHGFFEYERGGEKMMVNSRHIPELGWHVIIEQSESEALSKIWKSLIVNTLIGLTVIAITILIVSYTLNRYHSRLQLMASTDKLTGIGNRAIFDHSLRNALQQYQRDKQTFSVIMVDIDHFKHINDSLGHLEGDRVIKEITYAMQKLTRGSDMLCRWGGEELIILAHNCSGANAVQLAENIRRAIEAKNFGASDDELFITVSAGVSETRVNDDVEGLIRRADTALYQAKHEGRNCIRQA